MNRATLKIGLLALISVSQATIAESLANISIGYEQTSGDYGSTSNTDITTVPVNLQYMYDAWRLKLSVPFISVTGDGTIIPGTNGGISGMSPFSGSGSGLTTVVDTQSGLGDVVTSLSYALMPENNSFVFAELTAEVKWGTASSNKYLGTGENDFSVSLYTIYEEYDLKPFITLGYLIMGDTDLTDYNDVAYSSAGMMFQLNEDTVLSLAYDYQQTTIDGTDDSQTISLYLSKRLNQDWTASAYTLSGLSDAVADSGFGFTLIRNF